MSRLIRARATIDLPPGRNVIWSSSLREFRGHAVAGGRIIDAVAWPPDVRTVALAQPIGRLDDRIEHRLKIEFRAADDLENLGSGSLLFKCDAELRGARLHLLEKPRVLDCDHRLVGECR